MLSYNLKCKKKKKVKTRGFWKHKRKRNDKDKRILLLWNCIICNSKKLRFIKEQEASELSSGLETRMPLRQVYLVAPLLF